MSDLNLLSEIVKTLDYSSTSKERLLQLVGQKEERTTKALVMFVQERESACQEAQKQLSMINLKQNLDAILFGKPIAGQQTVLQYTPTPSVVITETYSYNNGYQLPPVKAAVVQAQAYPVNNNQGLNSSQSTGSFNGSSSPSGQFQHNQYVHFDDISGRSRTPSQCQSDEAVKKNKKTDPKEFDLDKRIMETRNNQKPNKNQVTTLDIDALKQEQKNIQTFKELWVKDQPLQPELYKLFYDAVDNLDFAQFLGLRQKLDLDDINVKDLITKQREALKAGEKAQGINPIQFLEFMNASHLKEEDVFFLLEIFFYLDFNNNGLLDADEILLGFVMLAKSHEKEKLETAFYIVDEDGSGTLDVKELTKYMRSVIRMGDGRKFHSSDAFEHELIVEKIAAASALEIFKQMDLNQDGRISFEEFVLWHNMHGEQSKEFEDSKEKIKQILITAQNVKRDNLMKYNAFTLKNDDYVQITNERMESVKNSNISTASVNAFRQQLQLDKVNFLDAIRFLKVYKVSEKLGFPAFFTFMKELYAHCRVTIDINNLKEAMNEFFESIDLDQSGFVEWNELLGAFSLMCVGTENEKVKGIFEVFDNNGDNVLSFNELYTLFQSSFNLIFLRNPESELAREDPKKLAFSMALSAFSDNQLDPYKNALDLETFSAWYKNLDMI